MRGRVVLGVTGGIAAYKAAEVLRELQRAGCDVRVVMTQHATELVHPRTFAVLSEAPVQVDQWDRPTDPAADHIELARWADLLVVAPATANMLAKMSAGIADDALSTYHLAHTGPVLVAPAMHTAMWRHPATRESVVTLQTRGVGVVAPGEGHLACGDVGEGRLADPEAIVDRALRLLPKRGPLAGARLLVTAGPTREPVDRVRVLTNRSSGRMGAALAQAGRDLGAHVHLLHGSMEIPVPLGVDATGFTTAEDLQGLLRQHAPRADAALLVAAVSDLRPARVVDGKIDRREGETELALEPVPDLAAELGARDDRPYLVVFAAEDGANRERALAKMRSKGADAVVLNDISTPGLGMESADNRVWLLGDETAEREIGPLPKEAVARELLLALSGPIVARSGGRA